MPHEPVTNRRSKTLARLISAVSAAFWCFPWFMAGHASEGPGLVYVSLMQLIAQPHELKHPHISVVGYLGENDEFLYLTEAHSNFRDRTTGISITMAYSEADHVDGAATPPYSSGCESRYVRAYGYFQIDPVGTPALVDVYKLEVEPDSTGLPENVVAVPRLCWESSSRR